MDAFGWPIDHEEVIILEDDEPYPENEETI
jgi:hypothetical protein